MQLKKIVIIKTKAGGRAKELAGEILTKLGHIFKTSGESALYNVMDTWIEIVDTSAIISNKDTYSLVPTLLVDSRYIDRKGSEANRMLAHVTAWKHSRLLGDALTLFVEDTCTVTDLLKPGVLDIPVNFDLCFVDGTFNYDSARVPALVGINPDIESKGFASAYVVTGRGIGKLIEHFTPLACHLSDFAHYAIRGGYDDREINRYASAQNMGIQSNSGVTRRDIILATWHKCFQGVDAATFAEMNKPAVDEFPYNLPNKMPMEETIEFHI